MTTPCFRCERPATWELVTATQADPGGVGLRAFCDEHTALTRSMIEDAYADDPRQRRNMLGRIVPLVMH
jgi:hypothetical protein